MSLLPQQILPPNAPIGQVNAEGMVIPTENYWLFFYNLWLNTIATGLPADALQSIESVDFDVADVDALQRSMVEIPESLAIPTLSALLEDSLLPDPTPQAQPVAAITVGASPFTYTARFSGSVAITGGTVSSITLIRQSTSVATGVTAGLIPVSRLDQVQVTFTGTPTMTFIPWSAA